MNASWRPQVLCYALAAGPLPPVTRTLEIGELARRAVLAKYGGEEQRPAPPQLSGHDPKGPVQSNHGHTFFLPVDLDTDGHIDHLLLYLPGGFDADVLAALERLEGLYPGDGAAGWPLRLKEKQTAAALRGSHGPWASALVWESVTPYVLSRYPKQYRDGTPKLNARGEQRDGPEEQARRDWAYLQAGDPTLPDLVAVDLLPSCVIRGRELAWRMFQVRRRWGTESGTGFAFGLRLRFAAPVAGPVLLGYGRHFGLGQFRPAG